MKEQLPFSRAKEWLKKHWWVFPCVILASLFLPFLINFIFMNFSLKTGAALNDASWLGFWGSYLGGLLGTVAALIALYLTYQQQKRHDKEEFENAIRSQLPIMSCYMDYFGIRDTSMSRVLEINGDWNIINHSQEMVSPECVDKFITEMIDYENSIRSFEFQNIGLGPAYEVEIHIVFPKNPDFSFRLGGFAAGEKKKYLIAFPLESSFDFEISYKDLHNIQYSVSVKVPYGNDEYDDCIVSAPERRN